MRLKSLRLRNFCQHVDRTIAFPQGMLAITGPNGSGKSNVLAAVQYALIGKDPNYGKLADSVNWQAAKGAPAEVVLEFEHGSADYCVTRSLRDGRHQLSRVGSEDVVTGATQVTERVLEILGTTPALVADYVLVGQGQIAQWFSKTPSARSAEIGSLLRLDAAERVHVAVGRYLGSVEVPAEPADLPALHTSLHDSTQRLNAIDATISRQPSLYDLDYVEQQRQRASVTIRTWQAEQAAAAALQQWATAVSLADRELQQAQDDVASTRTDWDAVSAMLASLRDRAEEAIAALDGWVAYDAVQRARASLEATRARIAEFGELVPVEAIDAKVVEQASRACTEAANALTRAELRRDAACSLRVGGTCPTCKQPIADDSQYAVMQQQLCATVDAASTGLAAAARVQAQLAEKQAAYDAYAAKLQQFTSLQSQEASLAAIADVPEPAMSRADAAQLRDEYQAAQDAVILASERIGRAQSRLLSAQAVAAQRQVTYQQQLAAATPPTVTAAEYQQALDSGEGLAIAARTAAEMQSYRATTVADVQQLTARIAAAEQTSQQRRAVLAAKLHLEAVRNVLHKDAAPRVLVQQQLAALVTVTNGILEECGIPFTVSAGENCQLMANFAGGSTSDRRLSGGQRSLLGMVFRTAMTATLLRDVGLLGLDEPTEFIDEDNQDKLPMIFRRLQEVSAATGLQLIVITHDQRILPIFDNVIAM